MSLSPVNQMHWDDVRVLLAVCRYGSLSAAARALGSSHSTVFRQVNAIETRFATRFFQRKAKGYEMTEAGELIFRHAENIEEELIALHRQLQGTDLRLQGNIRLTAPEGVSHYLLMPHLASFQNKHPDITIELLASSEVLQLGRGEADLAIRVTDTPPDDCIGRRAGDFHFALYASKVYLDQHDAASPEEMDYVICSHYLPYLQKSLWRKGAQPRIVLTSDSIVAVCNAAKQDLGCVVLPCMIGEREESLTRVYGPLREFSSGLWLLAHADLRQTARVKALMQHLYDCLSQQRLSCDGR